LGIPEFWQELSMAKDFSSDISANFCADHFDNLKIILQKLEYKNVVSIQKCINMLSLESVKNDLTLIQSHFFILVKSIKFGTF